VLLAGSSVDWPGSRLPVQVLLVMQPKAAVQST